MAISFDSASVGIRAPSGAGPLTFSHTVTGSNTVLFVGCFATAGDVVTGITYNSISLTQVSKVTSGGETTYLYYLIAPTTGANNISVSWTGNSVVRAHGASYTGAKQSGVPDASATNNNTSTTIATTLTTIADNCWTIVMARCQGDITAGAGTVLRGVSATSNILDSNSVTTPAGSKTLNVTSSASGTNGTVMASFAPAPAGSSSIPDVRLFFQ